MNKESVLEILLVSSDEVEGNDCFNHLEDHFNLVRESPNNLSCEQVISLKPIVTILGLGFDKDTMAKWCKDLSSTPELEHMPIIVSTLSHSIEERMLGYEMGAYAYFELPLDIHYLKKQITSFLKLDEKATKLSIEAKSATETALSALVGNSELGQAIRFVEKTYALDNFNDLAESFFSVTNSLNLRCVIYMKSATDDYFFSSDNKVLPIESELLARLHDDSDRFVDLNHRTLIFYPRLSVLIKNMPVDDPERYGRIKDLLPSMMGAADARIVSLDTESALTLQTDSVSQTFDQVRDTLNAVAEDFELNQQNNMKSMSSMLSELNFNIPSMGLEDDQENYLLERIGQAVDEASDIASNGKKLNGAFKSITMLLDHLSRQQHEILDLVKSRKEEQADQAPEDDIEFF